MADELSLLDWKRTIAELYAEIRATRDKQAAWQHWQATRRRLFLEHPQSPVPVHDRGDYTGPHVYDYDPSWCLTAAVETVEPRRLEIITSNVESMAFSRFGLAHFKHDGTDLSLELYWLEGYGGGAVPAVCRRDERAGNLRRGALLLDTVKGADLGEQDGGLVLDFNFAYQPSCAYDPRWTCPLAPPANRLSVPVRAGERVARG